MSSYKLPNGFGDKKEKETTIIIISCKRIFFSRLIQFQSRLMLSETHGCWNGDEKSQEIIFRTKDSYLRVSFYLDKGRWCRLFISIIQSDLSLFSFHRRFSTNLWCNQLWLWNLQLVCLKVERMKNIWYTTVTFKHYLSILRLSCYFTFTL